MGDIHLGAPLRESDGELKRLRQAAAALATLVADSAPDPAHVHCLADELRTCRRDTERRLRDLQERVELEVDKLGDDGAAWDGASPGCASRRAAPRTPDT